MKQTQIKFLAFCEYAILAQDNKLSLLGMFDQVTVSKFPGGLPRAFFVASFSTEPNSKWKLSVEGRLNGKVIFPPISTDAIVGNSGNHNWIVDLKGFVFPEKGNYEFFLAQDDKEIGSTVLNVMEAKNVKLPN